MRKERDDITTDSTDITKTPREQDDFTHLINQTKRKIFLKAQVTSFTQEEMT